MKNLINLLFIIIFSVSFAQKDDLKMTWKIKSKAHYEERLVSRYYNSANEVRAKKGEKLYRYVMANDDRDQTALSILDDHHLLWNSFIKQTDISNLNNDVIRKKFKSYVEGNMPTHGEILNILAPRLYFEFIGKSETQYILTSITVVTLGYEGYMGGGFFNDEAWYDILLRHNLGTHKYNVDQKLRFTGSGSAILRFWSDNFARSVGLTPEGCYFINIIFNFTADGKEIKVESKPFKMDV